MTCYIVLFHGSVVGVMSSAVDAAQIAKQLSPSSVVSCRLNALTETGAVLLMKPAPQDSGWTAVPDIPPDVVRQEQVAGEVPEPGPYGRGQRGCIAPTVRTVAVRGHAEGADDESAITGTSETVD